MLIHSGNRPRRHRRAGIVAATTLIATALTAASQLTVGQAGADSVLNYRMTGFRALSGPAQTYLGIYSDGTYTARGTGGFNATVRIGKTVRGNTAVVGGNLTTTAPYAVNRRIISGTIRPLPTGTRGCHDLRRQVTFTYTSPTPAWTTVQFVETELRRPLGATCVTIGYTITGALNRP